MTDPSKGKVASLTGSLLARKGGATPAGFSRAPPGDREPPERETDVLESRSEPEEIGRDQHSLEFGRAFAGKSDTVEEGWAPLSQIVIRPHPFMSKEAEAAGAPEPSAPVGPSGDFGVEPSLLMDRARSLAVTLGPGEPNSEVTVETPRVPLADRRNEPIIVVSRVARDSGAGGDAPDVEGGEFEELAAPTLGPVGGGGPALDQGLSPGIADRADTSEQWAGANLLAAADSTSAVEPDSRAVKETRPAGPGPAARAGSGRRVDGRAGSGAAGLAPVTPLEAKPRETRRPEPTPIVVPPVRIGELQAQARVISRRSRRRGRVAPVIWAVVALVIFLGVTWQVYRTNRGSEGGLVSSAGPDGGPTIWATVDELGYAVSQILAALTGGLGPKGEAGKTLAVGVDDVLLPSPKFVPVGPVSVEPDGAGRAVGNTAAAPVEALASQAGEQAAAATADVAAAAPLPAPLPPAVARVEEIALGAEPLPAPPVPAAPVVADREGALAPATPKPVGVTAPPAPPLSVDIAAAAGIVVPEAPAPQAREEVNTAVTLEPLAAASVAVAAGSKPDSAPIGATEIAALPPSGAVEAPVAQDFGVLGGGMPVLKPAARPTQQSLGVLAAIEPHGGASTEEASVASDGYAVQLSSLKTRVQAEREFERLKSDYPGLLRAVDLVVREGSVTNRGTFFRVLTSRFEDAGAARVLCRSLRERGQDCLVVRR